MDPTTIITNIQKKVRQRGQERLTIMIVPHGQEKIFSLQLNWLMIAFLSGILAAAVALSIYGIYKSAQSRQELQKLKELYGQNYNNAQAIEVQTDGILKNRSVLNENLEEIAAALGYQQNNVEQLLSEDDYHDLAVDQLQNEIRQRVDLGPNASYLKPVYHFKATTEMLNGRKLLMDSLSSNVRKGLVVFEELPLGRPLKMNTRLRDSSYFGMRLNPLSRIGFEFHSGFDISGPPGTPILATGKGRVERILRYDPGYGNAVILEHKYGYYTLYAHMRRILVENGQLITRGEVLGEMGRTGRVTGTHVHYEVWRLKSNRIDPKPFICALDIKSPTCKKP